MTFNSLPRADVSVARSCHDLYRVWQVPGRRDSDYYDGTGIEKTYNLIEVDREYPTDVNACPVLQKVTVGSATYEIINKEIDHRTIVCPQCDIEGKKTESGKAFCPECGLLLSSTDAKDVDYHLEQGSNGQPLARDSNSAGRF